MPSQPTTHVDDDDKMRITMMNEAIMMGKTRMAMMNMAIIMMMLRITMMNVAITRKQSGFRNSPPQHYSGFLISLSVLCRCCL